MVTGFQVSPVPSLGTSFRPRLSRGVRWTHVRPGELEVYENGVNQGCTLQLIFRNKLCATRCSACH